MPELPEVETTCQGIRPFLECQVVQQIEVRTKALRWPIPTQLLKSKLVGQTIQKVSRRAKYILIEVPNGQLIIHLGMSGNLRILDKETPLKKHDHFECLINNKLLRLNDPRRFGAVLWVAKHETHPLLEHLGPEPLETGFSGKYLHQIAQSHRTAVKTFIMNQKIVVGVGNIYASECLFLAHIHPLTPANQLSLEQYQALVKAIRKVLKQAIAKGGTTLKDFRQSVGKPGYFSQALKVYDRESEACERCGSLIQAMVIGQRSTYYCARCQPLAAHKK